MAEVGLDPAHSRLALPGYTSTRLAFCDGTLHGCTVNVDERGAIVDKHRETLPTLDYSLEPIFVPGHSLLS